MSGAAHAGATAPTGGPSHEHGRTAPSWPSPDVVAEQRWLAPARVSGARPRIFLNLFPACLGEARSRAISRHFALLQHAPRSDVVARDARVQRAHRDLLEEHRERARGDSPSPVLAPQDVTDLRCPVVLELGDVTCDGAISDNRPVPPRLASRTCRPGVEEGVAVSGSRDAKATMCIATGSRCCSKKIARSDASSGRSEMRSVVIEASPS